MNKKNREVEQRIGDEQGCRTERMEEQLMRLNMAMGEDKVSYETWEFMHGEAGQKMMELIKGVWEGEGKLQENRNSFNPL